MYEEDLEIDVQSFFNRAGNNRHYNADELKMVQHNDYYVAVLGFATNSKGGTCKVELALTPNNKNLFQIRYRNKSIKGLTIVRKNKLKNLKADLNHILNCKEACEELINLLTSKTIINKFKL